jgi:hypothetical protein
MTGYAVLMDKDERKWRQQFWINSIVGFIITGLTIGLIWIFFTSVLSFLFLTPFFTIKYLGDIHLLKILLIIFGFAIVIGIFQDSLKKIKKQKKRKKKK